MSKRFLFVVTAILFALIFPLLVWVQYRWYGGGEYEIAYLLAVLVISGLHLYSLRAQYIFPEHILFSIIPILVIFAYLEGVLQFFTTERWWYKVIGLLVGAGVMYITSLTLNIFKAATVRTVPLLKAARTTLLIIIFIISVIWSVTTIRLDTSFMVIGLLWGFFSFLASATYLYLGQVEVVEEFRAVHRIPFHESFVITWIQLMVVFLTYAWPATLIVRTAYWSTSLLVLLVVIHGKKTKSLTQRSLRELVLMTWVLFLMILISGLR
jgi:hypothetical protein